MLEGFRRQFVLVTVAGIPVRAGAGWFLVLLLLSLVTAASIDQQVADLTISLILVFAATAFFFLSIFIH